MSEQKTGTITLTVPWHEDPVARAAGTLWDGRDRTGAAKDGRSIAVLHADIGKALLAAWPGTVDENGDGICNAIAMLGLEPTDEQVEEVHARFRAIREAAFTKPATEPPTSTADYAKRLAEIEAEVARRAKPLPFYYGKVTAVLHEDRRDDLGWLLGQLRAASEALAALGIPADGRPLAERMADLGKTLRGALHDAGLLRDMQGRKCHDDHAVAAARRDADILKRAARAAAIAGGEDVPEDAGPEAVAAALRRSTDR